MKTLKKITLILTILISQISFAQEKIEFNKTDTLYWFHLKLDIVRDTVTHWPSYKFSKVYPEIFSGTKADYLGFQKGKLKTGYLAIGPFETTEDAKKSMYYYVNCNKKSSLKKETDTKEYSCYLLKIEKVKKNNSLELKRQPSSIFISSINNFKLMLFDVLPAIQLVIGPFTDGRIAENSKFLNKQLAPKRYRQKKYINYQTLYWFSIKLNADSLLNKTYVLDSLCTNIKYGTIQQYYQFKQESLKNKQIPIGPFFEFTDVESVRLFYKSKLNKTDYVPEKVREEYYWYFLQVENNNKAYKYKIQPAAIQVGNFEGFKSDYTKYTHMQLIGPFTSMLEAEASKSLFRITKRKIKGKDSDLF